MNDSVFVDHLEQRKLHPTQREHPMKLDIDPIASSAYFEISAAEIETTTEIEPGVIADYDANGHLVGIEVLNVNRRNASRELDKAAWPKSPGSRLNVIANRLPVETSR
jgi:uncharacterized protein YuzE